MAMTPAQKRNNSYSCMIRQQNIPDPKSAKAREWFLRPVYDAAGKEGKDGLGACGNKFESAVHIR